jgi:hypothetical protein
MVLSDNQSIAVTGLLRYVNSVAVDSLDQRLTLLALALVLSCQNCGVQKAEALAVIGGIFDDDPQTLVLMQPPSPSLH